MAGNGYAQYADFLGEISPEEEARQAAARQAAASTPASQLAQTIAANRQTAVKPAASGYTGTVKAPAAPLDWVQDPGTTKQQTGQARAVAHAASKQGQGIADQAANLASDFFGNPIINPIGYGAKKIGGAIDGAAGTSVSGYIQDPVGQGLSDLGAPDFVQAIANPTGFATRTAVNANTGYGTNPGAIAQGGLQAGRNLQNDARNTVNAVQGAGGYLDDLRRTVAPGAQGGAPGGAGGAPGGAAPAAGDGVQRPDQYRTDALDPQIQAMLDAERKGGPSEAEALLKKATDRVAARSLGIAAGARGGAGARERARNVAMSTNASLGATAAADTAALRAREANESKVRQQAIMSLLQGNAAAGDVRDLGYEQAASGERSAQYNVNAADSRAAADRQLTRDQFNAQQQPGLLDDPLSALFNYFTGRNLRSQSI